MKDYVWFCVNCKKRGEVHDSGGDGDVVDITILIVSIHDKFSPECKMTGGKFPSSELQKHPDVAAMEYVEPHIA